MQRPKHALRSACNYAILLFVCVPSLQPKVSGHRCGGNFSCIDCGRVFDSSTVHVRSLLLYAAPSALRSPLTSLPK